ncbi:MAG: methyltransferase [Planctomycetota bacterium]
MTRTLDEEFPIRPFSDPADFGRVREWFLDTGFTRGVLPRELRMSETTPPGEIEGGAVSIRLSRDGPLSGLLRLFVLGCRLSGDEARAALGPVGPERWREAGILVEDRDGFRCPVRLTPFPGDADGWGVGDSPDHVDRPDFVMCPSSASEGLARLLVRRPVESLLDLGAGGGFFAILGARSATRVTATDLCPRARPIARFNAALNGCDNVDVLEGSLYEPVAGRTFDRIVANAPFVLGPGSGHVYRDSGGVLDGVAWRAAREAPAHLAEGGICQMLIHWPLGRGEESDERVREWLSGLSCDVWMMVHSRMPAADYARRYLTEVREVRTQEYAEAFARWHDWFRDEGVEEVAMGSLALRRRSGDGHWVHVEEAPGIGTGSGEDIALGFEVRDFLRSTDDEALLTARPLVDEGLELHQRAVAVPGSGFEHRTMRLLRTRGLRYEGNTDPMIGGLVARFDGETTAAELVAELAEATGGGSDTVRTAMLSALRGLLEVGFVRLGDGATTAGRASLR